MMMKTNKGENVMKENTKENILNFVNSVKGLLLKKMRTEYGFTQREMATLIDRSEVSVRKYETAIIPIPFSVIFLTVHILKISRKEIETYLNEIIEKSEDVSIEIKEKSFKKMKLEIERIFENIIEEIEEDTENNELDEMQLEKQIKIFVRKHKKYSKNSKKINETLIGKEIMSFLKWKIDNFVDIEEEDEELEE
jgi:hypothetical protein